MVSNEAKKSYASGYLLVAKQRLLENSTFSDTPLRLIEESNEHKKEKNQKIVEKCKIRSKLKTEPMIKCYRQDDDDDEIEDKFKEDKFKENKLIENKFNENKLNENKFNEDKVKDKLKQEKLKLGQDKLSQENVGANLQKNVKNEMKEIDYRCLLKPDDLDKKRVLTAMGGLFYAGELKAIEPPDVYSITLDGDFFYFRFWKFIQETKKN